MTRRRPRWYVRCKTLRVSPRDAAPSRTNCTPGMSHRSALGRRALVGMVLLAGLVHTASAQTWQRRAPLPTPRSGLAAVAFEGAVYAVGGRDAEGAVVGVVERYDPAADRWTAAVVLDDPVVNAAAAVYDGRLVVLGGREDDGDVTDDVQAYDAARDRWESMPSLLDEREGHAAVVLGGRLCVVGGSDEDGTLVEAVACFDGERWAPVEAWDLGLPRALLGAAVVDGAAYTVGGYSVFGPVGQTERYAEGEGTEDRAGLAPPRGAFGLAAVGGRLYAVGGRDARGAALARADAYDPVADQWTPAAAPGVGRDGLAVAVLDGRLYALGGTDAEGRVTGVVEVLAADAGPTAADDVGTTDEDVPVTLNVLQNDAAGTGRLSIQSFTQPSDGTVTLDDGTLTYRPRADFFGTDGFAYTIVDEAQRTAQAAVTVTVRPVNDPPRFVSTPVRTALVGVEYAYAVTVEDVDDATVAVALVAAPSWLQLAGDGRLLRGTPGAADVGRASVTLEVSDGEAQTQQAFVVDVQAALGRPTLRTPADGADGVATSPRLAWSAVAGASGYDVQVARDAAFQDVAATRTDVADTMVVIQDLAAGTPYFWRVRARSSVGAASWSDARGFTTAVDDAVDDPERPALVRRLDAPFPNPSAGAVRLAFVPSPGIPARLDVFDLRGRHLATLWSGTPAGGRLEVVWDGLRPDGAPWPSGVYVCRLQQGTFVTSRTFVRVR